MNINMCAKCMAILRIARIGVAVQNLHNQKVYQADLHKCPECSYELLTAFGSGVPIDTFTPSELRDINFVYEEEML